MVNCHKWIFVVVQRCDVTIFQDLLVIQLPQLILHWHWSKACVCLLFLLISILLYLLLSNCVLDSYISDWVQKIKSLISMEFLSANFWLLLFCFVFFPFSKLLGSAWISLLNALSAKWSKIISVELSIPFSLLYQFLSSPLLDFLLNSGFVVVLKWDMTGSFYVFLTSQPILGRKAPAPGRKYKSKQANSHSSRRVF